MNPILIFLIVSIKINFQGKKIVYFLADFFSSMIVSEKNRSQIHLKTDMKLIKKGLFRVKNEIFR